MNEYKMNSYNNLVPVKAFQMHFKITLRSQYIQINVVDTKALKHGYLDWVKGKPKFRDPLPCQEKKIKVVEIRGWDLLSIYLCGRVAPR